jgi:hypothetical protein
MAKATAKPKAKAAAKPKAKAAPKSHGAFRPKVHVRMYCHGLGDCFLLRFETKKDEFFDVLVDCGIYKASPDAGDLMNQVVDDIIETTGNELDVLVSTHEHWDHISGFSQALKKFQAMKIGHVWQAWTEDPKDPLASKLRKKYEGAKAKLFGLMRTALTVEKARMDRGNDPSQPLDDAFNVMGFFGLDKHGDEEGPYEQIKALMLDKKPLYLRPGDVRELGETGVQAFVLGPPADETVLRKQDIAEADAFHKQQMALFDGMEALMGAVESGLEGDTEGATSNRPFDRRQEIPEAAARQSEFFQVLYGFDQNHPEHFRSIDDLASDTLGSLALRMDKYINNTSLVLAFRLPSGQVLLFPGDAQGGNWKSWADPANPLAFKKEATDAHRLLADTVFYKVAHHGSHNATPKTYGLDLMTHPELRAFVPVDHAIAQQARYGEMPLVAIMNALSAQTSGAVFRSDGKRDGLPKTITFSEKELSVRVEKDGKPIVRRLYCETAFELG